MNHLIKGIKIRSINFLATNLNSFHIYSFPMPGEKIRSKKIRVQVKPLIPPIQYWIAIGSGLACIAMLVILVLVIFAFRRFEVQHELTCRSTIIESYGRLERMDTTDSVDSVQLKGNILTIE